MPDSNPDAFAERARELQASGVEWSRAFETAWLEERMSQWPENWGNSLRVLVYGDFDAPTGPVEIPSLGITVSPEEQKNTVIRGAMCVLEATVAVTERTVPAIIDATRRVNILLGAYTLVEWGNAGSGWWSWITHDGGGGVGTTLAHDDLSPAIEGILHLRPEVRRRVEAALYWVREPRNLLLESHRHDLLRVYSSYWNAFECLVEAIIVARPMATPNRQSKQHLIDDFIAEREGRLTAADVQDCYQRIVNPGFVGRASHALRECFGETAEHYIEQCFRLADRNNRLYDIRNAINHGDVDAENPEELLRIQSRLHGLWIMLWGMFGRLVPFSAPVDTAIRSPEA